MLDYSLQLESVHNLCKVHDLSFLFDYSHKWKMASYSKFFVYGCKTVYNSDFKKRKTIGEKNYFILSSASECSFILFLLYTKVSWILENSIPCMLSCLCFRYWILSTTVSSVFKNECKRYLWHIALEEEILINNYLEIVLKKHASYQTNILIKKILTCSNCKGDMGCTRRKNNIRKNTFISKINFEDYKIWSKSDRLVYIVDKKI